MISPIRPSPERVEAYRAARLTAEPTAPPRPTPPKGFRHDRYEQVIGSGAADLDRARLGLQRWAAHRGSGVEVLPADAGLTTGTTVAILTRQLGLWVLAACRVTSVIDEPTRFGFTYATLPGHPERGYESFVVELVDDDVVFRIEAVSRPDLPLLRLGSPITQTLQRRATNAYLRGLASWVATVR